jgi:Polyketide cyclase / dehydrase and lipid transport
MTVRSKGLLAAGILGIALCSTGAFAADGAPPADYAVLNLNTTVDAPVAVVWKKIGGYCDIKDWLKAPCTLTSGTGDVGTVRHLAFGKNGVDEVMVAKTAHSYTYTQPTTTILYHGTLEVVPDGKGKSKILYNLIWDQAALTSDEAKTKDRDGRTKAFTGALANMKAIVEGK